MNSITVLVGRPANNKKRLHLSIPERLLLPKLFKITSQKLLLLKKSSVYSEIKTRKHPNPKQLCSIPDMPFPRYATSPLLDITPAMSRCSQFLLFTNSCQSSIDTE